MSGTSKLPIWPVAVVAAAAVIYLYKNSKKEGFTDGGLTGAYDTQFIIKDGKDFNTTELGKFGIGVTEEIITAPTPQRARALALAKAANSPTAVAVKVVQEGGRVIYSVVHAESADKAKSDIFLQFYQFYTSDHTDRGLFIKKH